MHRCASSWPGPRSLWCRCPAVRSSRVPRRQTYRSTAASRERKPVQLLHLIVAGRRLHEQVLGCLHVLVDGVQLAGLAGHAYQVIVHVDRSIEFSSSDMYKTTTPSGKRGPAGWKEPCSTSRRRKGWSPPSSPSHQGQHAHNAVQDSLDLSFSASSWAGVAYFNDLVQIILQALLDLS